MQEALAPVLACLSAMELQLQSLSQGHFRQVQIAPPSIEYSDVAVQAILESDSFGVLCTPAAGLLSIPDAKSLAKPANKPISKSDHSGFTASSFSLRYGNDVEVHNELRN
ncbi:hypothetical protein NDU88_002385 [Pleurodeles waltl]|uniref:Uncharacterized protein n=1 Tax=Pleurodeles waltl TaxID=8319 RepID=A0AAV7NFA4_PLEWA|nr:hypothetical protein NDU88_002385 [Pleurodeles waltl]